MKKSVWKTYAVWILLSEAVGALSGWLTRDAVKSYGTTIQQPPLAPPGIVFPVIWTILFALMGIVAARIYMSPASGVRSRSLFLFFLQLLVNFFWSIIFFNLQALGFAFLWLILLWILILLMIRSFYKVSPLAAWIQLPYFLWVTFAA
ncbi:MAG: tryptophan-rich sensory protein, partial [Oscillospiraceae bacterium]|nr:tryptophan-rich sensory protein [Oscillospiraceae bacterium]